MINKTGYPTQSIGFLFVRIPPLVSAYVMYYTKLYLVNKVFLKNCFLLLFFVILLVILDRMESIYTKEQAGGRSI